MKKSLWFSAIELEEQYGSKENQEDLIRRAMMETKHVFFFLKLAKFSWKFKKDAKETRDILLSGYKEHPDSEDIVLAIQKFERENGEYDKAEKILLKAKDEIPSERVAMQAV